jgi:hypothetical protein
MPFITKTITWESTFYTPGADTAFSPANSKPFSTITWWRVGVSPSLTTQKARPEDPLLQAHGL